MKKIILGLSVLAIALTFSLSGAQAANYNFQANLTIGSTGADVVTLQTFLESKGYLVMPVGVAKGYFGPITRSALARFQAANGISPAAGYFGPITRAALNAMVVPGTGPVSTVPGCLPGAAYSSTTGQRCDTGTSPIPGCLPGYMYSPLTGQRCDATTPSTPSGGLTGGAGSVDSYQLISGLSNEEVGEDQEDVEVAGLEVEVDEGSDIEITAVRLVFNEGTADQDFEDYASDVSIWLGDEEVARLDADEFNDDNDWSQTVSLDSGAIIRKGDTEDLVVAVSGISNLDSNDAGETWTVDFETVRFRDAQGATISDLPGTDTRTFSFDTFASANDLEMRVSLDSDNPDENVIVGEDSDEFDAELLRFSIKAEGSDIEINDLPVLLTATGADTGVLANELVLSWDDGDEEASEQVDGNSGSETITFEDLGIMIDEGDSLEFVVTARMNELDGTNFSEGDELRASVTVDDIDAEDSAGEDISDSDATGSANGEDQHFFSAAPEVRVVSTDIDPIDNGSEPAQSAKATIQLEVTARGDTIYLNGDNETTESQRFFKAMVYGSGISDLTTASTTVYSVGGQYDVTNSGTDDEYYTVEEGDTMTVTLEFTINQAAPTTSAVAAGVKAAAIQFGTENTNAAVRSSKVLDWTDLTDQTQSGTWSLVNPS